MKKSQLFKALLEQVEQEREAHTAYVRPLAERSNASFPVEDTRALLGRAWDHIAKTLRRKGGLDPNEVLLESIDGIIGTAFTTRTEDGALTVVDANFPHYLLNHIQVVVASSDFDHPARTTERIARRLTPNGTGAAGLRRKPRSGAGSAAAETISRQLTNNPFGKTGEVVSSPSDRVVSARVGQLTRGHLRWCAETYFPATFRFPDAVETYVYLLASKALRFILAHEYAHVALGHLQPETSILIGPTGYVVPWTLTEQSELAADLFAAEILTMLHMDSSERDMDWDLVTTLQAIRILFSALQELDNVYYFRAQLGFPTASERFLSLISRLDLDAGAFDRASTLSEVIELTELDLGTVHDPKSDLIALVRRDPVISWRMDEQKDLDPALVEAEERHIRGHDGAENRLLVPMHLVFEDIGTGAFPAGAFQSPPPSLRQALRFVARRMFEVPNEEADDESWQAVFRGAAGDYFVFSTLAKVDSTQSRTDSSPQNPAHRSTTGSI